MLTEATDTSQIDIASRSAIMDAIEDTLVFLARGLSPTDLKSLAIRIHHHPTIAAQDFAKRLGVTLTRVAHTELRRRFGDYVNSLLIGQHGRLGDFPVRAFSVRIIVDDDRYPQGELNFPNRSIDIVLPSRYIAEGLLDSLRAQDSGLPLTIHNLIVHEFAHVLQDLEKRTSTAGLSYSTGGERRSRYVDANGRVVRGGKRAARDPGEYSSDPETIRYLANADEIDAYASQAAAEISRRVDIDNPHPKQVMDELLLSLRTGNPVSPTANLYLSMLRSTFDNHYPMLKKNEIFHVWKRFVRALWKKLHGYYRSDNGNINPTQEPATNSQWVEWAQRLPRSAFVVWLAGQVADNLLKHKSRSASYDRIMDSIADGTSSGMQHDAERFIETYYFGYAPFESPYQRIINVFRRLVQRKVMRALTPARA